MNFKKLLGLALIALLILIALANTDNVSLLLYGTLKFTIPLWLVIGISGIIGILIAILWSAKTPARQKAQAPTSPQTQGRYNGMKLYVGNLPYDTTEDDLIQAFSNYGSVRSARIITDKITGEPRGFGFVEMEHRDDAHLAINELNGTDMHGNQIKVNKAHARQSGRRSRR
jgi:uncharacterized integral membrane protein